MTDSSPDSRPRADDGLAVGASAEVLLERLDWTVIKRLDGRLQGDHRTFMRGQGMDLSDLRSYQYSDDVRQIDWNVTARLQEPHVRVYTEDREMTAWFLLDLSPSMDFGSSVQRKRDVAHFFAATLARLLTRSGNRVAAIVHGTGADTVVPPGQGRAHVLRLLHVLRTRPTSTVRPDGSTRLDALLHQAAGLLKRRSAVFVLSDFVSAPGWESALGRLAQRHDVLCVRLADPLELELPDLGLLPIRDAETGEQLLVDTHDPAFRRRFAAMAAQREADLRAAFTNAGVDALELSTDEELVGALQRFAELRQRRASLSGSRGRLPAHLR